MHHLRHPVSNTLTEKILQNGSGICRNDLEGMDSWISSTMKPKIEVVKRTCAKPQRRRVIWLVDDSVKRCEYKLGPTTEIKSHGQLNRPVVKSAPVFYDCVSVIENSPAMLALLQIRSKSHPTTKINFWNWFQLVFKLNIIWFLIIFILCQVAILWNSKSFLN